MPTDPKPDDDTSGGERPQPRDPQREPGRNDDPAATPPTNDKSATPWPPRWTRLALPLMLAVALVGTCGLGDSRPSSQIDYTTFYAAIDSGEVVSVVMRGDEVDCELSLPRVVDGKEVKLTAKEMAMLKLLAEKSGEVISRESFLREVWGLEGAIETRTVDNFVRKLRQLFEDDASEPRHLLSVRGVGYRFVP